MPIIAILGAIRIRMHHERDAKHHSIHVHAEYGDDEAVYDLDGNMLQGNMARPQDHTIKKWIQAHRADIMDRWDKATKFLPIPKI